MKKRILAALLGFLLLTAVCAQAEYVGVNDDARKSVNIFLSNFTEQGIRDFEAAQATDAELCEFAARHILINRPQWVERGSWSCDGEYLNARVPDAHVPQIAQLYTGRTPGQMTSQYMLHVDGCYYFSEGAPLDIGFASMSAVQTLSDGCVGVYFGCYGQGWGWSNADCALRPEEAAARYPDCPVYPGYAVIDLGGAPLGTDRSAWHLVSLHINP